MQIIAWLLALAACRPQADMEKVAEFYSNGNAKKVLAYSKTGEILLATTYHWNQIRATRLEYDAGVPHGNFERWDSKGNLVERGKYVHGMREGTFELFFERNSGQGFAEYQAGLLHGEHREFFPNEKPRLLEFWNHGNPIGLWMKWDLAGNLRETNTCHVSSDTGSIHLFYPTGIIQKSEQCQKGIRHGNYEENYPNGNPKVRGGYLEGKVHGLWIWTRADKSAWMQIEYSFGIRNGRYLLIGSDGDTLIHTLFQQGSGRVVKPCISAPAFACADTTWEGGQIHGILESWDSQSRILTRESWVSGKPTRTQSWRTDSVKIPKQLLVDGGWANGKREGLWRTWHNNGKLKDSLYYHQHELWGTQTYFDSTGHLYMSKETRGKANQVIIRKLDPRPLEAISP